MLKYLTKGLFRTKRSFVSKRWITARQRGISLVEPLIAVAILSLALVTFLGAFSSGSLSIARTDRKVTAEALATSQMEYTKSLLYVAPPTTYQSISPVPTGYTISANATSVVGKDSNIEKITVTVTFGGKTIFTLEDLKVNR